MKKIHLVILLLFGALGCIRAADAPAPASDINLKFKEMCRKTIENRLATPLEKLQYVIAWGASYDLDAMLDGYLATGDPEFLDMFVKLADRAVAARADTLGIKDYRGRLRAGWLADPYYGTGGPVTLPDASGKPSIEVRSTLLSHNQETEVTVTADPAKGTFALESRNAKAGDRSLCKKIDGLTMDNVEEKVNTAKTRTAIKVRKVGDQPPVTAGPVKTPGNNFVMHGHHTGKGVVPLLRFALAVKADPALSAKYGDAAARYLKCAEEAITDMDQDWREHPDGGYIVFEPGMPFWCDGVAEPNNTLALSGLAYLYLYDATGRELYLERARKLATFMKKELEDNPDGTVTFYYWTRLNRLGWGADAGSVNTPVFVIKTPLVEDTSHFQLSLRFFAECRRHKLVITDADMAKLAKTFHARIDRGNQEKPLAERVDGSLIEGVSYQHSQAGWAEFYDVDPAVPARIRQIFEQTKRDDARSSVLATWGTLLRGEAAKGSKPR
jgi:hypothetical protein